MKSCNIICNMKQLKLKDAFRNCARKKVRVCSIDPGYVNLGFVVVDIFAQGEVSFVHGERVDITKWCCRGEDCNLGHSATTADWLDHFLRERRVFFKQAQLVLIERQPPFGFRDIEQILFHIFRSKAVLVSPRSMHKHFNVQGMEYDNRKSALLRRSVSYFSNRSRGSQKFNLCISNMGTRCHDVSDALCITIYYSTTPQLVHAFPQFRKAQTTSIDFSDFLCHATKTYKNC